MTSLLYWPQVAGPIASNQGNVTDPYISKVALLCHMENNLTNSAYTASGNLGVSALTATAPPSPEFSSTVYKFGSYSVSFAAGGSSRYATGTNAAYSLGTADYTIEFWCYLNGITTLQILCDTRTTSSGSQTTPAIYIQSNVLYAEWSASAKITSASGVIPATTWTAVSLCRVGGSTRMFVNGSQVGSTYSDSNNGAGQYFAVGSSNQSAAPLSSYFDEVRVTVGVGRYTANYNVQKIPFPNN